MKTLSLATMMLSGCAAHPEKAGLAFAGGVSTARVQLLVDETWVDAEGTRHVEQEIFDSVFGMIDDAETFILIDLFLMNDFGYVPGPCLRPLSQELADRLVAKRISDPQVKIVFITDPINTIYGSVTSLQFKALEAAGVQVVWTDLDRLRDSNPLYSKPWRLLAKPFGTGPGRTLSNPLGPGRISARSYLKLFNFKANHRKIVVTEKALLVTSANPHSASSAHWNTALRIDGAGMHMACVAESAILRLSGAGEVASSLPAVNGDVDPPSGNRIELLTEIRIKNKALELLNRAVPGARIDLCMFYLSDKEIIQAFIQAAQRGATVRVILDPSKDAFGREKNGVPNRQSAAKLVKAGIPLRWAETHGEQCHVKMLYVEQNDGTATLLLGSSNFTRRNLENFNCEADAAYTAARDEANMQRARAVFDRWWNNSGGRTFTTGYETYEDPSRWRRFNAWWKETTGMGTF